MVGPRGLTQRYGNATRRGRLQGGRPPLWAATQWKIVAEPHAPTDVEAGCAKRRRGRDGGPAEQRDRRKHFFPRLRIFPPAPIVIAVAGWATGKIDRRYADGPPESPVGCENCCRWMGHSRLVARKHCLHVTDEHLEQASRAARDPARWKSKMRHSRSPYRLVRFRRKSGEWPKCLGKTVVNAM
jgi:hypothetical protein